MRATDDVINVQQVFLQVLEHLVECLLFFRLLFVVAEELFLITTCDTVQVHCGANFNLFNGSIMWD